MDDIRSRAIYSTVPSDWKIVPLRKLLWRVKKPVEVEADGLYREIGIFSHGKGIFHKEERTGVSLGNKSVFWVEPDCFVANIVFAWEQAIAKTTDAEKGMIASHRFPMYKPKAGTLGLDFLVSFFNTPQGKYLLGLASPGGAGRNKTLGQQAFLDLSIPLPPFPEQRKITGILSTVDQAIVLTERRIDAARQRKKGLMQRLLTGRVRFPEFEGEEWREVRLGQVSRFIRNGFSSKQNKLGRGYPVTRIETISDGSVNLDAVGYAEVEIEQLQRYRLRKGDILFSHINSLRHIAKAAIFDVAKELYHGMNLLAIRLNEDSVDPRYVHYLLCTQRAKVYFQSRAKQAINQASLNSQDVAQFHFLLPSHQEQQRIVSVLQTCDREIELLTNKREVLQRQKKGLMQRLLTGRVRVKV